MICYNEAIDDEILELLEKADVTGYTKWTKVLGKGRTSGPHFYSHIWPKANNVITTALPQESATKLMSELRKMKEQLGHQGIKAFMWQIDEMT